MRYHDHRLRGYAVEDFGRRIVLDLVFDSPDGERRQSTIVFSDVACHAFEHATESILTEIEERDVALLAREEEERLTRLAHEHGSKHWRSDIDDYVATLEREGLRGWRIVSAIGFGGFVIARSVEGSP